VVTLTDTVVELFSVNITSGLTTNPPAAGPVTVNPAIIDNFAVNFTGTPRNQTAFNAEPLLVAATVTARDTFNNVITAFDTTGDTVTITASVGAVVNNTVIMLEGR
jgi:hypothetical protein